MRHETAAPRLASIRLATGPRLHYAEQGEATGEPLLLLHGWPDSWVSYSQVLPWLPSRFRAFVPDQRGFGESDRPPSGYTIDDLASDAAAFLDAVAVPQATLVGHSMGTFVARRVAERYPDRVARLVLIGSSLTPVNDVTREVHATLRTLADPVPVEFAREFQASTVHVPLAPGFFDRLLAESRKLPARLWRAVFDGIMAFDDSADLGRITAPTLLLWGEQDALFSRAQQQALAAAIPGARLIIYPDTGHCPNWERPDRVAADLLAFLQPV